ncbi:MAG TPA: cache domain-containing protein [Burkholderiales bacterium]|nr:cache domain-containing protein [Burkholderiales bacterium]
MRLRSYLVSLALATVLPVAVFGAIVGYFLVGEQRDTFRRGAEARVLAITTAVDAELQGMVSSLDALSRVESLANRDFTYFRATAKRFLETHPHWTSINLARPDGERVLDPLATEGAALPPIQRFEPSFERALQTAQPMIGDLAIGPVSKQWDFVVRVPVVRDGKVDYVLSAVIKPEAITRLLVAQGLPADWFAVVLDRNNRIVARTVEPAASVGQVASQSLRDALARSSSGWFRGSTIEGSEVYTPFRRSEWSGWSLAMGIPVAVVDGAAGRGMGYLAAGLAGALGLALVLAGFVGRRLAAPIAELA